MRISLLNNAVVEKLIQSSGINKLSYLSIAIVIACGFLVLQVFDDAVSKYAGLMIVLLGVLGLKLKRTEENLRNTIEIGAEEIAGVSPEGWEVSYDHQTIYLNTGIQVYKVRYLSSRKVSADEVDLLWARNHSGIYWFGQDRKKQKKSFVRELANVFISTPQVPIVKGNAQAVVNAIASAGQHNG